MRRGNGGIIGPRQVPSTVGGGGMWSILEVQIYKGAALWPAPTPILQPLGKTIILADMDLALTNLVLLNTTLTTVAGIPKAKSYALASIFGSD